MQRVVLALLALLLIAGAGAAQEFSERQDIAIFRLNYYGAPRDPVPDTETVIQLGDVLRIERRVERDTAEIFRQAVGAVDERIRSVFVNMRRFNVIGLDSRLAYENVDAFIEALKEYRADNTELPDTVLLGQEAFTEADFNRLVGAFYVVIPSVSYYNLVREQDGDYHATIETSITIINTQDMTAEEQFFIETEGYDEEPVSAMRGAVRGIPSRLEYQVRRIDAFRLRTSVLEVNGREVILEFGRDMGVRRGDEYAVVEPRVTSTGHTLTEETGLITIKEVNEEFSVGRIRYADGSVRAGDQLREVPRFGAQLSAYGHLLTEPDLSQVTGALGLRATATRGFYRFRPQLGVEIPLTATLLGFVFPMNIYGGGEWNWYVGRVTVSPSFSLGFGGGLPVIEELRDEFLLTHVGGTAQLSVSVLLGQDTVLTVDAGYGRWFGFYDSPAAGEYPVLDRFFGGYGGILTGIGVTFK
jgi:hypothetical protein